MSRQGKCGLCRERKILQRSHFTSKGITNSFSTKTEDPWTVYGDYAEQTPVDVKDLFLCGDCEKLLNDKGENWVMQNLLKRGRQWRDKINDLKPKYVTDRMAAYAASELHGFKVDVVAHFALGIFWRAAARSWKLQNGTMTEPLQLGPSQESIRRYLLGRTIFPQDVVLMMLVDALNPLRLMHLPTTIMDGDRTEVQTFVMSGWNFNLYTGEAAKKWRKNCCLIRGGFADRSMNPFMVTTITSEAIREKFAGTLMRHPEMAASLQQNYQRLLLDRFDPKKFDQGVIEQ